MEVPQVRQSQDARTKVSLETIHINFTTLAWYYVSIHYMAALFSYFLCRDLGRSVIAAVLAGVAFGLGA